MGMKTLITFLLLLSALSLQAANPAFENFNTNHFSISAFPTRLISIRDTNVTGLSTITNIANNAATNAVFGAMTNGNMVYVDAVVGSDVLVRRWNFAWPALTPNGAKTVAAAGDTVYVRPGTYSSGVTNLFKGGVNWHLVEATFTFTDTGSGPGSGFFDDRFSGAVTSNITGSGRFIYSTGSGFNAATRGAFVITSSNSVVRVQGRYTSCFSDIGDGTQVASAHVLNCKYTSFDIDEWIGTSNGYGVYWETGPTHVRAQRMVMVGGYCIWGNQPNTAGTDLWLETQLAQSTGDGTPIYMSGITNNYRMWIRADTILSDGASFAVLANGGGRLYIIGASKISANTAPTISAGSVPGLPLVVWLNAQKITSNNRAIELPTGASNTVVHAFVQHFEDTGSSLDIVNVLQGTLHLHGGRAEITSGKGIVHGGGTTRINGLTVDCSATSKTTNYPVLVQGISGGTSLGLMLQDCVLVNHASTTNSIFATNAQNVKIYGTVMAKTNKHPNITIATGTFNVDGGVQ